MTAEPEATVNVNATVTVERMGLTPSKWNWLDEKHCANCGRGPEFFLTKHHEKVDGKRTGRATFLCRDCHSLAEGVVSKEIMRGVVLHAADCKECYGLLEQIRKHSGFEQKPVHKPIQRSVEPHPKLRHGDSLVEPQPK